MIPGMIELTPQEESILCFLPQLSKSWKKEWKWWLSFLGPEAMKIALQIKKHHIPKSDQSIEANAARAHILWTRTFWD